MKDILEERILDAKIEFTLREVLGIAKKDFHELIIDVIKRKRQMTAEAVMVKAFDTMASEAKTEEEKPGVEVKVIGCGIERPKDKETKQVNSSACAYDKVETEKKPRFSHPFWARATTETKVKLDDSKEYFQALVDHGSEINIMSRSIYERGMWPITTNHGWVMKVANNEKGELFGACPAVKVKIGDVEVEQNFFVQDSAAYPVILGQPYITATRMETKVLDDGSHYARIRSCDGKRSVQFLTVKANNWRNRDQLDETPLKSEEDFLNF
jgi:hypothetical protein